MVGIGEIDPMTIKLILIGILLSGCSVAPGLEIGYWETKFTHWSKWQCVENYKPYLNKEC